MKNFTFTEKDLQNMKKADLISLIQSQGQEVLQALQEAQEAQKKADLQALQAQAQVEQAQAVMQEVTGLSPERIAYEDRKFAESITCTAVIPEIFSQDTVEYRQTRQDFLIALGRKYLQEVLQNEGRQAGKQAGRKARKADRPAGTTGTGRKAVNKAENDVYRYICNRVATADLQETDKYTTLKKEGKTVARLYIMRDNKVKALVKEEVAKKAGLAYTLMKFNLPASVILHNVQTVDALLKAF